MVRFGKWMAMAAVLACAGCGGEQLGGHPPSGTGGSGTPGFGGTTGVAGAGGSGSFCGAVQTVSVPKPLPPDILIVMDRSSSLLQDSYGMSCTGGCGPTSKWALLSSAVESLVAGNPGVNWGLMLLAADDVCGVDYVPQVLVGPGTGPQILSLLAGTTPGGEAPTAGTIYQSVGYLQSLTDGSSKYLLLVSDGSSNCVNDPVGAASAAVGAVADARAIYGVPTFVMGLPSSSDAAAAAALTQMATNGGEPLVGGQNAYYTPSDDLSAVLGTNVGTLAACALSLNSPLGPDVTIAVTVTTSDGRETIVPQDPLNGWTFSDQTESNIFLNGTFCTTLKQGGYTAVTIDYQCPMPSLINP
jgi:hypothetical protein